MNWKAFVKNENKASENQQDIIQTKIQERFHYFIATAVDLQFIFDFSLKNINVIDDYK